MRNMPEKIYYLSSVRATLIGLILMLMGFGVSFIGSMLTNLSGKIFKVWWSILACSKHRYNQ